MKIAATLAFALLTTAALADDCMPLEAAKGHFAAGNGSWTDMTHDQLEFMRGVFAQDPATPDRLPFGDKAALATQAKQPGAMVFFVDGDLACDAVTITPSALKTLMDIGAGEIGHAPKKGDPL